VTTRRLDDVLDPRTLLAVSTYRLRVGRLDDCDGTHALARVANEAEPDYSDLLESGRSVQAHRPSRFRASGISAVVPFEG
jgi:hypothetical protein